MLISINGVKAVYVNLALFNPLSVASSPCHGRPAATNATKVHLPHGGRTDKIQPPRSCSAAQINTLTSSTQCE